MHKQSFVARHISLSLLYFFLLAGTLCSPVCARAQAVDNYDAQRKCALQLYDEQKYTTALPILEKLSAANSSDVVVMERLGFAILMNSATIKDPQASKQERNRARTVLLRAQALGDNSNLLQTTLAGLPPGGGNEIPLSRNKEAEAAMNEGEKALRTRRSRQSFRRLQECAQS